MPRAHPTGNTPRGAPRQAGAQDHTHTQTPTAQPTHHTQHSAHTQATQSHSATQRTRNTHCTTTCTQHTNKLSQQRQNTMASSRTGSGKWRRLRKEVIEEAIRKEQFNCPLCGIGLDYEYSLQPNSAEVDHILEHSLGGQDVKENVRVICRYCNQTRFHKERRNRKPAERIEPETKIEW